MFNNKPSSKVAAIVLTLCVATTSANFGAGPALLLDRNFRGDSSANGEGRKLYGYASDRNFRDGSSANGEGRKLDIPGTGGVWVRNFRGDSSANGEGRKLDIPGTGGVWVRNFRGDSSANEHWFSNNREIGMEPTLPQYARSGRKLDIPGSSGL